MGLAIVQPAPLHMATTLAFRSGRAPRRHLQAMILQVARSDTMAFVDRRGAPVMVVGLWPWPPIHEGERLFELWLLIDRAALSHLPALRRFARLMLSRAAESGPVRIRALVREGHAPGARMCRLVGMAFVGVSDGFECWEWSAHEQDGLRPHGRRIEAQDQCQGSAGEAGSGGGGVTAAAGSCS